MKKLLLFLMFLALYAVLPTTVEGKDEVKKTLADQLPASRTILYAELDIKKFLEGSQKSMELIDADSSTKMVDHLVKIKALLQQGVGEDFKIKPKVFDELESLKVYLVGMKSTEHANNPEKMMEPFVVFETSSNDVASNFTEELESLTTSFGMSVSKTTLGNGVILQENKGDSWGIGHTGRYIVISIMGGFKDFYTYLESGTTKPFSDTKPYKKHLSRQHSYMYAYYTPKPYLPIIKDFVKQNKEAETFYNMFSIDKLEAFEIDSEIVVGNDEVKSITYVNVHHDKPLTDVVKALLNGGAPLSFPKSKDGISMMYRMDVSKLFDSLITEYMKGKSQEETDMVWKQINGIKKEFGVDPLDLGDAFAGDFYFFFDVKKKKYTKRTYDYEANAMKTETIEGPCPDLQLICGLKDAEEAQGFLDAFFESNAMKNETKHFNKRTYNDTTVYVVGEKVDSTFKPNGYESYAIAIVGKHIKAGSWESVTSFIDTAKKGGEKAVDAWVKKNAKANMAVNVPAAVQKKLFDLIYQESGMSDNSDDVLKEMLTQAVKEVMREVSFSNADVNKSLKESMETFITDYLSFAKKAEKANTQSEAIGQLKDGYYEIKMQSVIKKASYTTGASE